MNVRCRAHVSRADLRYMWVSVAVMAVTAILSLAGYSMIGVLLITFWTFLLALLHKWVERARHLASLRS